MKWYLKCVFLEDTIYILGHKNEEYWTFLFPVFTREMHLLTIQIFKGDVDSKTNNLAFIAYSKEMDNVDTIKPYIVTSITVHLDHFLDGMCFN